LAACIASSYLIPVGLSSSVMRVSLPTAGELDPPNFACMEFYEVRQKISNITHLSDTPTPLTGVCCRRYVGKEPCEGAGEPPALLLDRG
jgi:hypothetical protein